MSIPQDIDLLSNCSSADQRNNALAFARHLSALHAATTPGNWKVREFVSAPATEKSPAIETRKISPIQRTALGSLSPADAEFIVFVKNNWHRIQAALESVAT